MFPHRCQSAVTQTKVYDYIARMYLGRYIFSTSCSIHVEFDEQIRSYQCTYLIQSDKHEHVMITCSIFRESLQNNKVTDGSSLWKFE
jgi:hypothetical protein